jgi:hypothetical protein
MATQETDQNTACITVAGAPINGLNMIGPFNHPDDALAHAENRQGIRDDTWWIAPLHPAN